MWIFWIFPRKIPLFCAPLFTFFFLSLWTSAAYFQLFAYSFFYCFFLLFFFFFITHLSIWFFFFFSLKKKKDCLFFCLYSPTVLRFSCKWYSLCFAFLAFPLYDCFLCCSHFYISHFMFHTSYLTSHIFECYLRFWNDWTFFHITVLLYSGLPYLFFLGLFRILYFMLFHDLHLFYVLIWYSFIYLHCFYTLRIFYFTWYILTSFCVLMLFVRIKNYNNRESLLKKRLTTSSRVQ